MVHIESRPSKAVHEHRFFVDCKAETREQILKTMEQIKANAIYLYALNRNSQEVQGQASGSFQFHLLTHLGVLDLIDVYLSKIKQKFRGSRARFATSTSSPIVFLVMAPN